nr:aminoacyl tRNA synthase complex-interacting multifunctional protein 1-like [Procambarus clarkii]
MASPQVLTRLEQRAIQAEHMIELLTKQIGQLQSVAVEVRKDQLKKENLELRKEVERLKNCLPSLEKSQGITLKSDKKLEKKEKTAAGGGGKQQDDNVPVDVSRLDFRVAETVSAKKHPDADSLYVEEKSDKKLEKKQKTAAGGGGKQQEDNVHVDVSRLDFRVAKIVSAKKHPDADSLYVEEVDVGEEKTRTVVSGLVRFVSLEEMQNRMVVVLCNLKPAKMRGITSQAMVMCASTPDKVEILTPPEGSQPGDLVEFEGYTRNPDSVLNPKKKIFETCAPDLKTDANKVAVYKGIPFTVAGKGIVVSQTLANVQVK